MRVNDPNLTPAQLNNTSSAGGTGSTGKTAQLDPIRLGGSTSAGKSSPSGGDEVQLSSLSSAINDLQPGSPAREAYLDALQSQIANGTYQVDAAATSSKIVEEALGPASNAAGAPAISEP